MTTRREKFSRVPLIGGLAHTTVRNHFDASTELLVTLLASLAPIWLGAFVIVLTTKDPTVPYNAAVLDLLQNGELYLYAAAIAAPVFYIALREREGTRSFPGSIWHIILIVFFIYLPSFMMFALKRGHIWVNNYQVFNISVSMFILSILVLYLALVYNHSLTTDPSKKIREGEDDYLDELRKHRG